MQAQPMIDNRNACSCKAFYDRVCIKQKCFNRQAIYSSDCKCNPKEKKMTKKTKNINSHKLYRCPISSTISYEHFQSSYLKVVTSPIYFQNDRSQFKSIIKFTQKYNKGQYYNIQGDQMHYVWAQITRTLEIINQKTVNNKGLNLLESPEEQKKRKQAKYIWEKKPLILKREQFPHTERSMENIKLHELPMFKNLQALQKQIQDMQKRKSSRKIIIIKNSQKKVNNSVPQSLNIKFEKSKDEQIKVQPNSNRQINSQQAKIKQNKRFYKFTVINSQEKQVNKQLDSNMKSQKSIDASIQEYDNSLVQIKSQQSEIKQNKKCKITYIKNLQKKIENSLPQNLHQKSKNGQIKQIPRVSIKSQQIDNTEKKNKQKIHIVQRNKIKLYLPQQMFMNSKRHYQSKQDTKPKKIINQKGQQVWLIEEKKQHLSDISSKGNFDRKNYQHQQNQMSNEDDDNVSEYVDQYQQDVFKSYQRNRVQKEDENSSDGYEDEYNRMFMKSYKQFLS